MVEEALHLLVDGRILLVGADDILGLTPQGIHRVEFWTSLGQPQQVDVEALGQPHRPFGRVAGVFIQQQRHMPTTVTGMDRAQEHLEVSRPLVLARQEQPPPGAQVQRSEHGPPLVAAAQEHPLGLAPRRPAPA